MRASFIQKQFSVEMNYPIKEIRTQNKETQLLEKTNPNSSDTKPTSCCDCHKECEELVNRNLQNPADNSLIASFFINSSLHGFKYLGQKGRTPAERIFWFLMLAIGIGASVYFIYREYSAYNKNPVILVFDSEEIAIENIPFPAVTICNVNNILKSKAQQYLREASGPEDDPKTFEAKIKLNHMDHICTSVPSFSRKFDYAHSEEIIDPSLLINLNTSMQEQEDIMRFFNESSQNCSQMIRLCLWQGKPRPCEELFFGIESDYGFCCVFNMVPKSLLYRRRNFTWDHKLDILAWKAWNIKENGLLLERYREVKHDRKYPYRQRLMGRQSGLSVLLDPDLDGYFCSNADSGGIKMATHMPIEPAHIADNAVAIQPNSEIFVDIRPTITMSQNQLKHYSVEKRKCYYDGEFPLYFYEYYTQSNCFDECLANQTYKICECSLYFYPRDDSRSLCSKSQYPCTEKIKLNYSTLGAEEFCEFCFPRCEEIEYSSVTTLLPMHNYYNIWGNENGTEDWQHKNVSLVHIFFGVGRTYARLRSELFNTVDLIASTGGLLGLCLGFSMISVVEVIYFTILRLYHGMKKRLLKTQLIVLVRPPSDNLWTRTGPEEGKILLDKQIPTWEEASQMRQTLYSRDDVRYWKTIKSLNNHDKKIDHMAIDIGSYFY